MWNGKPIDSKLPFQTIGIGRSAEAGAGARRVIPARTRSIRLRASTTGNPRRSSASSSWPLRVDRDREQPGTLLASASDRAAAATSGSDQAAGMGQEDDVAPRRRRDVPQPLERLARMRRQVARCQQLGQRARARAAAGSTTSAPLLVTASLIAIRRRSACRASASAAPGKHQTDVAPGPDPLIEQEDDLLGRRLRAALPGRNTSSSRSANRRRNSSPSSANWIGKICSGAPLVVMSE